MNPIYRNRNLTCGISTFSSEIIRNQLENDKELIGWELLLRDALDNLRHGHLLPLLHLLLIRKERIQNAHSLTEHLDLQVVLLLKVIHELGQRNVSLVDVQTILCRPVPLLALDDCLGLGKRCGFRQCHEGGRQD